MGLLLSADEWQAVRLSVVVALAAVAGSLPVAIATAWLLARRAFRGKIVLETLVNLPLVLPPVVTGWLLLVAFGTRGFVGRWLEEWLGLRLVFDWKGAAVASAVVAFPLMVRAIRVAFAMIDRDVEDAARSLGAGRIGTFWRVTLPLARPGLVAGCVLAFARSIGEFGATIMIAGSIPGQTRTIPLYVYNVLQSPGGGDAAWRVVVVSVVVSGVALVVAQGLEGRAGREARVGSRVRRGT